VLDCSTAFAIPDVLFPPNHRLAPISVSGVTTPEGVPAAITITGITQDEPVNGDQDGNTCPDADGIGTETVQVRAERSGAGDGRVYSIAFRAQDHEGDECDGVVTVCVPLMRGVDGCVDQGGFFDSAGTCGETCSGTCVVTSALESVENVACVDDVLPSAVSKRIATAFKMLTRLSDRGRVGVRSRLLARASRIIRAARVATVKAEARGAISSACSQAAEQALDRASVLADQLSRRD
jgi:hypothetical protein